MTNEQQLIFEYSKAAITGLLRPYNIVANMKEVEQTCDTAFRVADIMLHRMKLRLTEGEGAVHPGYFTEKAKLVPWKNCE